MWIENEIFRQDLENIAGCEYIPWEELKDKSVFITGVTGLVGYTVTSALAYCSLKKHLGIKLLALVRDAEKARETFQGQSASHCEIDFICGSVEELPTIKPDIDYVIHCACPTASRYFVSNPVDTIRTIVMGTDNILKLAQEKRISGMVYLSSMEVFGETKTREALKETDLGYIDILSARSSYPEGKRIAESLCCAYSEQYRVPVTAARLAQTFGPGVKKDDNRVFAYMARCAAKGEDIRLNTSGSKENMYLYTMDAAGAILLLMLKGERGTSYNVGNPNTYCSVREMAQLVADELGKEKISVITNATGDKHENNIYGPEGFLRMSTAKLEKLGWTAKTELAEMFRRMIACY